jgi:hypothetical protein
MIDPKLKQACTAVDEWCDQHSIPYDIVCDETDLQGFMLFKKDRNALTGLLEHLKPLVAQGDVHLEMRKVRGGNILAFSLKAISEDQIKQILAEAGEEEVAMTFKERISDAFANPPEVVQEQEESVEPDFMISAKRIAESQRKSATGGMTRSNQTSLQRQQHTNDVTMGGVEQGPSARAASKKKNLTQQRAVESPSNNDNPLQAQSTKSATNGPTKGATKGSPLRFENRISAALELPIDLRPTDFDQALNETLSGMATATGAQPGELFDKFARALQVLGQQMGIGPLQDQLEQQGIKWKKSTDGMSIILYVQNAQTNAPQPIARITSETLENPRDFEDQLTNMLDFAKGEAPGTLRQKQQELKDQEGAIRDIAQAISPEDQESEVSKQMNQPQSPVAPAPAPAPQAAPQAAAPEAAAVQAASPKPSRQPQPVLSAGKIRKRSGLV